MDVAIPDGFSPWTRGGSAVTDPWEPIYERLVEHRVDIGTILRENHFNRRKLLHGGVIATLCDIAMGCTLGEFLRRENPSVTGLLTTHLSVDYVDKAEAGWMLVSPQVIHAARSSGITDAVVFADGRLIARASASFRISTGR